MVGREALGAYVGCLGPLLEPMLAVLGHLCWRSWAALGAYVGGLGPLLEPILGRSWAYVGGPGSLLEPMLAVLGRLGAEVVGLGPK